MVCLWRQDGPALGAAGQLQQLQAAAVAGWQPRQPAAAGVRCPDMQCGGGASGVGSMGGTVAASASCTAGTADAGPTKGSAGAASPAWASWPQCCPQQRSGSQRRAGGCVMGLGWVGSAYGMAAVSEAGSHGPGTGGPLHGRAFAGSSEGSFFADCIPAWCTGGLGGHPSNHCPKPFPRPRCTSIARLVAAPRTHAIQRATPRIQPTTPKHAHPTVALCPRQPEDGHGSSSGRQD